MPTKLPDEPPILSLLTLILRVRWSRLKERLRSLDGVTVPVLEFGRELRGSDRKDPAIGAPLPPTARAKAADVRFY
jgi:hypothetical protein